MSTAAGRPLGTQAAVTELLRGLAVSGSVVRRTSRGPLWLGRSKSRAVAVEVEGNPVTRVSLSLPARKGAGTVAGAFLNSFAPGSRPLLERALATWDVGRAPLDVAELVGDRRVRVQGFVTDVAMVVVTVEA